MNALNKIWNTALLYYHPCNATIWITYMHSKTSAHVHLKINAHVHSKMNALNKIWNIALSYYRPRNAPIWITHLVNLSLYVSVEKLGSSWEYSKAPFNSREEKYIRLKKLGEPGGSSKPSAVVAVLVLLAVALT